MGDAPDLEPSPWPFDALAEIVGLRIAEREDDPVEVFRSAVFQIGETFPPISIEKAKLLRLFPAFDLPKVLFLEGQMEELHISVPHRLDAGA